FFSPAVAPLLAQTLRQEHSLKWIHVAAAGVDQLLIPELIESSVTLTNAAGIFDRPIAEYVLACVCAHFKELQLTWQLQKQRSWRTRETRTLYNANVTILGAGGIGRETAKLLRSIGMEVTIVGRTRRS